MQRNVSWDSQKSQRQALILWKLHSSISPLCLITEKWHIGAAFKTIALVQQTHRYFKVAGRNPISWQNPVSRLHHYLMHHGLSQRHFWWCHRVKGALDSKLQLVSSQVLWNIHGICSIVWREQQILWVEQIVTAVQMEKSAFFLNPFPKDTLGA